MGSLRNHLSTFPTYYFPVYLFSPQNIPRKIATAQKEVRQSRRETKRSIRLPAASIDGRDRDCNIWLRQPSST